MKTDGDGLGTRNYCRNESRSHVVIQDAQLEVLVVSIAFLVKFN